MLWNLAFRLFLSVSYLLELLGFGHRLKGCVEGSHECRSIGREGLPLENRFVIETACHAANDLLQRNTVIRENLHIIP